MNILYLMQRIGGIMLIANLFVSMVIIVSVHDTRIMINASQQPVRRCAITHIDVFESDQYFDVYFFPIEYVNRIQREKIRYGDNDLMPNNFTVCTPQFVCNDNVCAFTSNTCSTTDCYGSIDSNGYGFVLISRVYDYNITAEVYIIVSWLIISSLIGIPFCVNCWRKNKPLNVV
jgi:hypothetical protein